MMTRFNMSATHQSPAMAPHVEDRELNSSKSPVLVAVGLDEMTDALLRAAHERAQAAGAPLVVCHVLPQPMRSSPLFPHHHQQRVLDALAHEREAYQLLTATIERLTSRGRDEYTLVFPTGSVSSGILALADAIAPGVVLVGSGDTAVLVALHEHHDTLVLRPTPKGMVLGATDLTDPTLPALEAAAREARERQRPLCLFHAVKPQRLLMPAFPSVLPVLPVMPSEQQELQSATLEAWQRLRDYSRGSLSGLPVDVQVVQGWPVKELARQTRRLPVELVVIANRFKAGLAGLLGLSVTQELLARVPCSVLVVKRGRA